MGNNFSTWLTDELNKRGWNNSDLARRADLTPSSVSMVISQQRSPGVEFCTGVASALRLPPEMVFRKAGLLPERADPAPAAAEILYLFNQLDEAAQEEALMIMRGYLREKLRRADTIPSATNA